MNIQIIKKDVEDDTNYDEDCDMNCDSNDIKNVAIIGKRNIDKLFNKSNAIRTEINEIMENIDYDEQLNIIDMLFQSQPFKLELDIKKMLNKKIQGYGQQDSTKKLDAILITFEEVVEKLFISKLKCDYCNKKIKLIYKKVRDVEQWTLDRIDNDLGHSCKNTIISCLKCNLQRRRIDIDKFMFTKKMVLNKIE